MEFRKPKPKKNSVPKENSTCHLANERVINGIFDGESVTVHDIDSMNYLYERGSFGKGTLSKGKPNYNSKKDDLPKLMFLHQFENQMKYTRNISCPQKYLGPAENDVKLSLKSVKTFLQTSFSDNEQGSWMSWKKNLNPEYKRENNKTDTCKTELNLLEFKAGEAEYEDKDFIGTVNKILELREIRQPITPKYKMEEVIIVDASFNPNASDSSLTNVNARLDNLPFAPQESLNLLLEESFFLKSVLGCLNIVDLNFSEIGIPDLWKKFNATSKTFTERYMTYHYYRAKGWVVKSGLKFGGDYLLYKDGPAYYHASYLVKVLDKKKKITWREFLAMNRLVETFNKDLVLTNIMCSQGVESETFPDVLERYSVQEVLLKRWFPSKERFSKEDKSCH